MIKDILKQRQKSFIKADKAFRKKYVLRPMNASEEEDNYVAIETEL